MKLLAKWLLNFILGYLGNIVGWVHEKIERKRELEESREAGRVEGAGRAINEGLSQRTEQINSDTHKPDVGEMNDIFKPRQ